MEPDRLIEAHKMLESKGNFGLGRHFDEDCRDFCRREKETIVPTLHGLWGLVLSVEQLWESVDDEHSVPH